jgi:sugar lactone lactonase YvrE
MMRRSLALAVLLLALLVPAAPAGSGAQPTIALPDEFRPEGIASGPRASFYVGSIPQGSVYRGSYRSGRGRVLVPPHEGRAHTGLKVDRRSGRLFVAGGDSKGIYVYNARSGADVRSFSLPSAGFVNDVVLTRRAAWFTDSQVRTLYRVPIGRRGGLSRPQRVPISGDLVYGDGFNANGIEALPGGRTLIVVQSDPGKLFTVNARTGRSREIVLNRSGAGGSRLGRLRTDSLSNGDGLLLRGRTLYVVRNQLNRIAVVKLSRNLRRGRVVGSLRDPKLDIPTTIAPFGRYLYAVNARFDRPDESEADIVRLRPGKTGSDQYTDPFADPR